MDDSIENFMTHSVHTLGSKRTLADAHALMQKHSIRHLPVLDGGKLVGMLTQRDLALVETLRDIDPTRVAVEDAMSPDVVAVELGTPVAQVAHTMAHEKVGSVVVQRGNKVVGIFTAIDALRALDFLLTSPGVKRALHDAMLPSATSAAS